MIVLSQVFENLTVLSSDLRLGDDELQRVAAIGLVNGMLQDTDRLEQVARHRGLAREVGRVCENLLRLGGEGHGLRCVIPVLHSGLDASNLTLPVVLHLIDVGVKHVSTTVDGGQTSKTLGKLAQTVERVDVWRFTVPGHRVHVQADTVDGFAGITGLVDVLIGRVQSHRVTNEVTGVVFKAELFVDVLHCALSNVQACTSSATGDTASCTEVFLATNLHGWKGHLP